jgi:hypothetical protein
VEEVILGLIHHQDLQAIILLQEVEVPDEIKKTSS